VLDGTLKLSRT